MLNSPISRLRLLSRSQLARAFLLHEDLTIAIAWAFTLTIVTSHCVSLAFIFLLEESGTKNIYDRRYNTDH